MCKLIVVLNLQLQLSDVTLNFTQIAKYSFIVQLIIFHVSLKDELDKEFILKSELREKGELIEKLKKENQVIIET